MKMAVFLLLFLDNTQVIAGNWNGTLRSKFQADNRISNASSFSGEVWGTYEYRSDDKEWYAAYNFLARLSDLDAKTDGAYGYDSGYETYQAFIQKNFQGFNASIKGGRFQRSDNLGFYLLDGAELFYSNNNNTFAINLFGGVPTRTDHLKTERGESLFGFDAVWQQAPQWHSEYMATTLDRFDVRFGYQQFANITTSHRLTWGINTEGRFFSNYLKKYEARFLGTYRADKNLFEDLLFEAQLDVNDDLRLRASFEMYDPDRFDFPTFRERYYNYYNQGNQALFRGLADYRLFHDVTVSVGGLYSNREVGDSGYGVNGAVEVKHWPGNTLFMAGDYVEYADETIGSFWFGIKQNITSRMTVQIDFLTRNEDKLLYGENQVVGGEVRCDYLLQSDLVISLDMNYISNSRLPDEHLARLEVTYYFDNFKPKSR